MRFLSAVIGIALLVTWRLPVSAQDVQAATNQLPCANRFEVTSVDNDPATVVLHMRSNRPLAGIATLYGADHAWKATVPPGIPGTNRYGVLEETAAVRGGEPVLGVQFSPAWAPLCAMTAPVRAHAAYDVADPVSAATIATDAGALPPTRCLRPYSSAHVIHAVEPTTPVLTEQQGIRGEVGVAIAIDPAGHIVGASVRRSPSAVLNAAALAAALASIYDPAVVGCRPVLSSYEFEANFY